MTLLYCHLCPHELQRHPDGVVELFQNNKRIGICCNYHSDKVHKSFEGLTEKEFKLKQDAFQEARLLSIERWMRVKAFQKAIEEEEKEEKIKVNVAKKIRKLNIIVKKIIYIFTFLFFYEKYIRLVTA